MGGCQLEKIKKLLQENLKSVVLQKEPMKKHTSFKTGGEADLFIAIENIEDLKTAIRILKERQFPYYIMGNGTNLLVRDKGYRGAILQLFHKMNRIDRKGTRLEAEAGALLSSISAEAQKASLTGFEFASGIPGTLGGAICMNAGAYDGEIKQVLVEVEVLADGNILQCKAEELALSYRKSIIPERGWIVLKGIIELKEGDSQKISDRIAYLASQRKEKQPLNFPSAGSTFKRPEGYFAGKLISDAGLKGFAIGGACVSEKHAGFIVNQGNATSEDILNLIAYCQKTVWKKFGVNLETEVKVIGEQ